MTFLLISLSAFCLRTDGLPDEHGYKAVEDFAARCFVSDVNDFELGIALDQVEGETRKQNGLECKRLGRDKEASRLHAVDFLGELRERA